MDPEQRLRALAFNALTEAMDPDWWLPLSQRQRLADAVLAAIEAEARRAPVATSLAAR